MPKNSEIIRAVKEGLNSIEIDTAAARPEWTEAVLTELGRIGRSFGYRVYAEVPESERDGSEWLYDVTWLEYEENGNGELINAPLVVECEWDGEEEIKRDFEKLLLARTGVRVMIFGGGREPREIAKRLARKVEAFNRSCVDTEDVWLLAAWEQNGDAWQFRYFKIEIGYSAPEC